MKKDNSKIGKSIKQFRQRRNLTQNELASLIGKTGSSIQKYESGVTEVPLSVLEKIAHVLGCHVLDFLDFYSSNEWLDKRDNAAVDFLISIGCKVIWDAGIFSDGDSDHSIIYYNSESYLIPVDELTSLISDMEFFTKNLVSRILNKGVKFPIPDESINP